MIISFIGHAEVARSDEVKELVKKQIKDVAHGYDNVTFYLGGYGGFDEICAQACKELKRELVNAELVYVAPYISISEQRKIKDLQVCGLCDSSVYPPLESTPPRFAISKRNDWMMQNADLVVAYVNHSYGGAYKALQTAKRKHKKIVNICDFL